eukprot:gene2975-12982_t
MAWLQASADQDDQAVTTRTKSRSHATQARHLPNGRYYKGEDSINPLTTRVRKKVCGGMTTRLLIRLATDISQSARYNDVGAPLTDRAFVFLRLPFICTTVPLQSSPCFRTDLVQARSLLRSRTSL